MSRWRPAQPSSTAYITEAGYWKLKQELDELWRKQRPEVVAALAAAAAEGDRSENAEYTYRKKQLAGIDRRVRYLTKRLPLLKVVREPPAQRDAIFFGAWVDVEDEEGREFRWRIVGPDEIDAERGWISIDAPVARALLGKRIDDEVLAPSPLGPRRLSVLAIHYADPSEAE